jgi:hypothetical protein
MHWDGLVLLPVLLSFLLFGDLIEELLRCHVLFGSLTTMAIKRGQFKCHVSLSMFVVEPHCHICFKNVGHPDAEMAD